MGKTETVKKRAIYVYVPSLGVVERWKGLAEKQNTRISKFVIEHVEKLRRHGTLSRTKSREQRERKSPRSTPKSLPYSILSSLLNLYLNKGPEFLESVAHGIPNPRA